MMWRIRRFIWAVIHEIFMWCLKHTGICGPEPTWNEPHVHLQVITKTDKPRANDAWGKRYYNTKAHRAGAMHEKV